MSVAHLTDANFQAEVLDAQGVVLVDVWATWCGPCRLMAPLMTWADGEYSGRLKVGKLDADGHPTARDGQKIQGLPTLILFKDGKPVATKVGSMPKSQLVDWLNSVIAA